MSASVSFFLSIDLFLGLSKQTHPILTPYVPKAIVDSEPFSFAIPTD